MKLFLAAVTLCALSACTTSSIRPDAQWQAYRAQVLHDEEQKLLSPSEAQARLRDGWVNIYGRDPTMMGYFAYSETLLRSAEQGRLPMSEAKELVKVKQQAAWAEYESSKEQRRALSVPDYDL